MNKILGLLFILILLAGIGTVLKLRPELVAELPAQILPIPEAKPQPQPEKYRALVEQLELQRQELATRYSEATSTAEKVALEQEARVLLEEQMPELMRCWLGTPWDFNGTSQTPGEGKIACGYFVSTVLRDAGFRVERFRLAQQASQNIIATFLDREEMHIRAAMPYQNFVSEVVSRGPGIQIVGLDSHVAFLVVNEDQTINFIHSSGARPWTVVDEDQSQAHVLRASNYRVTGNLTASQSVVQQWLLGDPWPTRT